MLRWSGESFGYQIEIAAVADPSLDSGVPGSSVLLGLVDAFLLGDESAMSKARSAVVHELGDEAFIDAAAVFGNFEMMNRIAEGTGIPVAPQIIERESETMQALGLYEILKSQHR